MEPFIIMGGGSFFSKRQVQLKLKLKSILLFNKELLENETCLLGAIKALNGLFFSETEQKLPLNKL